MVQFLDSGVNMTCEGWPYLGAAIGTQDLSRQCIEGKIQERSAEVLLLVKVADSQPHAAYAALTQQVVLHVPYHT